MKVANGKKTTNVEVSDEANTMKGGKTNQGSKTAKTSVGSKTAKTSAGSKSTKKTPAINKKAGSKKAAAKNAKSNKKGGADKKGSRYFKLVDLKTGKSHGRYTGDTPKQAASKGFTKMLQKLKTEGKKAPKNSTIFLRESTRGSARKVYGYEATRQKLPEPQELVITDKETGVEKTIVYFYRNKIHKVPVPEQMGGTKIVKSRKVVKKAGEKKPKGKAASKAGSKTAKTPASKVNSKKGSTGKSTGKVSGKSATKPKSTAKATNAKASNAKATTSR